MPAATASPFARSTYNPWHDLRDNWPEVQVLIRPLTGRLLGYTRYPVVVLRAGTSTAQRRCTLTHELIHLERGIRDCGPFAQREERLVHEEVARRLVPLRQLSAAVRGCGGNPDLRQLAAALDVDGETLRTRLRILTSAERHAVTTASADDAWSVA
jgi:hypothetical protein